MLDVAASANLGLDLIRMNRLDTVTTGKERRLPFVYICFWSHLLPPMYINIHHPQKTTPGLLTLAKTPKGATAFWEELRRDRVGKRYRALVMHRPLQPGLLDHFMPGKIIHRRPAPRCVFRLLCMMRPSRSDPPSRFGPTHPKPKPTTKQIIHKTARSAAISWRDGSPVSPGSSPAPARSASRGSTRRGPRRWVGGWGIDLGWGAVKGHIKPRPMSLGSRSAVLSLSLAPHKKHKTTTRSTTKWRWNSSRGGLTSCARPSRRRGRPSCTTPCTSVRAFVRLCVRSWGRVIVIIQRCVVVGVVLFPPISTNTRTHTYIHKTQKNRYTPLAGFFLDDEDDPAIQAIYPLCVEPTAPTGIALQCSGLAFLGRTVEAGEPWWRRRPEAQAQAPPEG